ncbi:MAG TPA: hypothetical protein DCS66_12360, partial [Flavobacteriaceae bacterium]|nr:hypothetical protein [Flavobacteriaceae bacterium]
AGGTHYGVFSQVLKAGSYAGYFSGNVYVSGVFTNPSDKTLKEQIKEASPILDQLNKISIKNYYFKKTEAEMYGFPKELQIGFIAQDFESIFPNFVQTETLPEINADGLSTSNSKTIKSINYLGMVPVLTKAIQEQQQIIETQQTEIETLKRDIAEIKALLKQE